MKRLSSTRLVATFSIVLAIESTASAETKDRLTVQLERGAAAEAAGDIVLAREHYRRAVELASAPGDERGAFARDRFAVLDARVPRLTVRLLTGAGLAPVIKRDGVVLGSAMLGVEAPVSPGEHEVVVEAAQRIPRTFVVTLAEGERKQLDVSPGAGAFHANGAGPLAAIGDDEDSEHTGDYSRRTVGTSLGAAGLGALGLGSIFGAVALANDGDEAHSAARISTGFLIGGAIAAVAGAVIFFTAPSSSR